ncbi:hypothetical protein [uncultured Mucilaginibacter sp.]|uniref:hypothetical protein n=1 Tax=uncultured Mucilaginibacter sp. TaxID=797541 RepID=UPI0026358389|nr:hypothetical protein [uncultured Mucilaginibacter sp.]
MRKISPILLLLILVNLIGHAQLQQNFPQLKTFQQTLAGLTVQFALPRDFREIKTVHTADLDVDYAMELPNENFQVWFMLKNLQQQRVKLKVFEDASKTATSTPDSLYKSIATATAIALAGKNNYTVKALPPEALALFNANEGQSYLLSLYNTPITNRCKYGLLICLQKRGAGSVSMLFLSNDNGPNFYKNVNKACYSVRFN